MTLTALVREPSPSFVETLSMHPEKRTINFERARAQHRFYVQALIHAGVEVIHLKPLEGFPDSTFVEDNALIFQDRAWICTMKAQTRQGETETITPEIEKFRPVETFLPPVFIDGGDVLNTDSILFIGQSKRTNHAAVRVLAEKITKPVISVPVQSGLHLKTSASYLGKNTILLDPRNIDITFFNGFETLEVDSEESYASNTLAIGDYVIMASGYPKIAERLSKCGFEVLQVPMSEFEKADGGITCLSLIIPS